MTTATFRHTLTTEDVTALAARYLSWGIEEIDTFRNDLADDAAYAFEWSSAAMTAAARIRVIKNILQALEAGKSVEQIADHLHKAAMNKAKYPSRSTSAVTNIMAEEELAAHVWALETILSVEL